MSISSTTRKAGPFACNGSTVAFPFAFKVFTTADVRVVLTDANEAESDLVLGTNYTVTLNADQDTNPGGAVTTVATYATGYLITLTSKVQNLQPVTLTNQGGFYPKVINTALDRLTILVQQVVEQVGRAVKTPISSGLTPDQLIADLYAVEANAANSATAAANSATAAANSATAAANSATAVYGDLASSAVGKGSKLVAFIQRMTGAVARWAENKLAETISVKDFGATGDGTTDDTTAIQAALTAAAGRTLFFPAGTYIATTLVVYGNTCLIGEGAGATTIKAKSTLSGSAALLRNNTQTGTVNVYVDLNIRVEGITFDGNGLGSRTAELVSFGKVQNLTVRDCVVQNVGYIGLAMGGCSFPKVVNCTFIATGNPVVTAEGGPAVWFGTSGDGTHASDALVEGCSFRNLEWAGIYASADRIVIRGNHFVSVKEAAIFSGAFIGLLIVGNSINGVTRKNISASGIETGASHVVITGNYIANVANCNIALTDTQSVTISGNTLRECRQEPAYYPTAGGVGIVTQSTSPNQPQNITITGNTFGSYANQPYAFVTVGNSGAAVTGVVIQDNNCVGNTYVSGKGVYWQSGKRGSNCIARNNIGTETAEPKNSEFLTNASTGAQAVTGIGFKPSRVELHAVFSSATDLCVSDSVVGSSGVATCHSIAANGTVGYGTTFGNKAINVINPAGANLVVASFTSFDDDGFTINLTTTTSQVWTRYVAYP